MPKHHVIKKEIKEQILERVKEGSQPITKIAEEHAVSPKTIYTWIEKKAKNSPSILELNRLRRENQSLKEILGELTFKLTISEKKEGSR